MSEWTYTQSQLAMEQGWDIFTTDGDTERQVTVVNGKPYGDRPFELMKVDESNIFASDIEAWRYVVLRAKDGDSLASAALAFLLEHSPAEYEAVMAFGEE